MRQCPIQKISQKAAEAGIPFLVIGGYAVLAHGYARTTDDLDLIVPHGRRPQWGELPGGFGMSIKNDAATFQQFDSPDGTGMEVDLNEVELRTIILKHGNAETYEKLRHACAGE